MTRRKPSALPFSLLAGLLFLSSGLTACSDVVPPVERQPPGTKGQLHFRLTTTHNGAEYRLVRSTLQIRGGTQLTLRPADNPGADIKTTLPVGDYALELEPNWVLSKTLPGQAPQLLPSAKLISQNPIAFTVYPQQLSRVAFSFQVEGETVEFEGPPENPGTATNPPSSSGEAVASHDSNSEQSSGDNPGTEHANSGQISNEPTSRDQTATPSSSTDHTGSPPASSDGTESEPTNRETDSGDKSDRDPSIGLSSAEAGESASAEETDREPATSEKTSTQQAPTEQSTSTASQETQSNGSDDTCSQDQ